MVDENAIHEYAKNLVKEHDINPTNWFMGLYVKGYGVIFIETYTLSYRILACCEFAKIYCYEKRVNTVNIFEEFMGSGKVESLVFFGASDDDQFYFESYGSLYDKMSIIKRIETKYFNEELQYKYNQLVAYDKYLVN